MTRVAVLLPSLAGGGAERTTLEVARGLADRADVDLLVAAAAGPLLSQVPSSIHLVPLGARRTIASGPAVVRYLRRERPTALLSALSHANVVALLAAAAARTGTRVVVVEHSTLSRNASGGAHRRDRILPLALRLVYPLASEIVAVSEGVADDLAATTGLPRDRVQVVPNPVPFDELERLASAPLAHPWASAAAPVVLTVGRLTAAKDHRTLLEALVVARRSSPDLRLVILGDGEERPRVEALVASLGLQGAVAMPGFVANPYPWYRTASVFALSSRWEGLPTVLLEALALRLPVVATDCPSGPAEILDGGRLGRLVRPGDPAALAAAILQQVRAPERPEPSAWAEAYQPAAVSDRYASLLGLP